MRSLNQLRLLRSFVLGLRRCWLAWRTGARIAPSASISLSSTLIGGGKDSIEIGEATLIAFKTLILARHPDGQVERVAVGKDCFIGGGSVLLPGITIGDKCIIAAGAVVAIDVPDRCIVAGNPAKIVRTGIDVLPYGRFRDVSVFKEHHGSHR